MNPNGFPIHYLPPKISEQNGERRPLWSLNSIRETIAENSGIGPYKIINQGVPPLIYGIPEIEATLADCVWADPDDHVFAIAPDVSVGRGGRGETTD
jgi:hypothetical protein